MRRPTIDDAGLAPGEVGKAESNQRTDRTEPASIRRIFGRGLRGYETAKEVWRSAHPEAQPHEYEDAMRRIARAVGI